MLWTQICVSFWIFSCGVRGDTDTEEEKNYILCQNGGACFPKDYDKNVPPNSSVEVALIPPIITNLREVNIFESTLTLDIYYAGMQWLDSRLQLDNSSNTSWNSDISHNVTFYVMPHSFEDQIWIPETMLADLKSSKTKGQRKAQSGYTKVSFGHS